MKGSYRKYRYSSPNDQSNLPEPLKKSHNRDCNSSQSAYGCGTRLHSTRTPSERIIANPGYFNTTRSADTVAVDEVAEKTLVVGWDDEAWCADDWRACQCLGGVYSLVDVRCGEGEGEDGEEGED